MVGGRQKVSIGRGCEHKAIVQHEILHALGRVHEQSRPDRDSYVFIDRSNIERGTIRRKQLKGFFMHTCRYALCQHNNNYYTTLLIGMVHNFDIMRANTGGIVYDYNSVMHYGARDFSSNGRPTIIPRHPANIGQREGLSSTDWKHIEIYCRYIRKGR